MIELAAALVAQKAELWRVLRMWLVLRMRCLLPSEVLSPSQQGTSTQFGVKHCKPLPWAPHAQGSHLCRARHQGKLLCPMLFSPLQVQVMLSTERGIRDASSSLHSSWLLFGVFASICLYPCVCLSAETSKTAVLGAKAAHSLEPGSFGAIHPPLPPPFLPHPSFKTCLLHLSFA